MRAWRLLQTIGFMTCAQLSTTIALAATITFTFHSFIQQRIHRQTTRHQKRWPHLNRPRDDRRQNLWFLFLALAEVILDFAFIIVQLFSHLFQLLRINASKLHSIPNFFCLFGHFALIDLWVATSFHASSFIFAL